ncbi:hypothetical protein GQ457_13G012370 [Hibiscus cannabinus]
MIWLKQFWGNALCCWIGPNHALFAARNIDKDEVHARSSNIKEGEGTTPYMKARSRMSLLDNQIQLCTMGASTSLPRIWGQNLKTVMSTVSVTLMHQGHLKE